MWNASSTNKIKITPMNWVKNMESRDNRFKTLSHVARQTLPLRQTKRRNHIPTSLNSMKFMCGIWIIIMLTHDKRSRYAAKVLLKRRTSFSSTGSPFIYYYAMTKYYIHRPKSLRFPWLSNGALDVIKGEFPNNVVNKVILTKFRRRRSKYSR